MSFWDKRDFFKLTNKSVFGKSMENLSKQINSRLINNAKKYKAYKTEFLG